jgi:sulfopropanediol 3-dehydrogenase
MATFLKDPNPPTVEATDELQSRVAAMLRDIEEGGVDAVRRYSRELDGWDPDSFVVSDEEFERVSDELDPALKEHIAFAQTQVRTFAQAQRDTLTDLRVDMGPGVVLGHRHIPVSAVGAYVPGGRYPMLASSFMTVCVAKVAGVEHVVACAPPQRDAGIHPAMLYAMRTSGADAVVCLGGVQALAAMAFGLIEGMPAVDMLVGAGNAYVAEAKRQLFGRVGIDLLAGPTEVLVIADETSDPHLVAADLLGQAEHGPTSPAGVIAIGEDVGRAVMAEVDTLLETWPTADVAGEAWRDRGWVAIAADDDEAIALADEAANEHLEVQVAKEKLPMYLERLRNYGSLFLGNEATVAYGDKAVGTNHVLPTLRGARYTGGLWVGKFLKTCTYQELTQEGTRRVAPAVEAICEAENFAGHGLTATMRLQAATR